MEGEPRFWMAGRFTPRVVDWMVFGAALLLSGPALAHAALVGHRGVAVGLVALPFGTVPLLWRRSRTGAVLAVLTAAFVVSATSVRAELNGVGLLFGVYAAALYGDRLVRLVAGIVAGGVLAASFGLLLATGSSRGLGHLVGVAFGYGVAWVLGDRTRTRRAYLAELEQRAVRSERERDEHARRAAAEERNRIARELHDMVAHNVSVIAVQAGAVRSTWVGPERAMDALGLIERTARSTLSELRALLGVLRKGEGAAPLRPRPTLGELDELVGQAREAGIRLEARVEGTARPLVAVVDLCAYRVVQEALTNAIKYAPNANVHLLVRYGAGSLLITVVDDGPGAVDGGSAGHGLIGMRERVALAGGELHVGPALGGGFRVEARLPIDPVNGADPADHPAERSPA
ncbi:MAG TPA: sensor histidine kinase [Actinomycetes bacterium]